MNKIYIPVAALLLIGFTTYAQADSAKPRWKCTGIVQAGLINGGTETNYALQTIHGVTKGNWMLGLGAGLDRYVQQSIPLVVHGQYAFGKQKSKGFLYGQAGPQIPVATGFWKDSFNGFNQYQLKTGWLAESGVGYAINLGNQKNLLFSLGYSIKQARYNEQIFRVCNWCGVRPEPIVAPTYTPVKLNMNRLILKVGFQF